jgi:hypothetical protein
MSMDVDGYLLAILTPRDQPVDPSVAAPLRAAVRGSVGGVLVRSPSLPTGNAAPIAAVTRRLADGRLLGGTTCFGPLDGGSAVELAAWLLSGGPGAGEPPAALDDLRLTPLGVAAAAAPRN